MLLPDVMWTSWCQRGLRGWSSLGGGAVIARMWRAWTASWDADAYSAHLLTTTVPQLRKAPGNLATYLLRRADEDCTEFAILSLWRSMDAVRAMAGEDVEQVEPHPEDARFFVQFDPAVVHYEIAERR
jgi:heme-degrading monooxygenase HmoA